MILAGLHWFDWLVLMILLTGFLVGWQRGLPGEWPRLVMWLLIVGLGRLAAPLGAEAMQSIGLTRMGGSLCGLSWTVVILYWAFESATREPKGEAQVPRRVKPSLTRPLGGAISGVLRSAAVVLVVVTMLAILPGGLTRFTEVRASILREARAGVVSRFYWDSLSFEEDQARRQDGSTKPPVEPAD
ncbi:MAG: hypothetical protein H7A46_01490 [Verrucomicrobiales bacterium]|nr:hypothetical protein [Verrucomicrobiales bacterium]